MSRSHEAVRAHLETVESEIRRRNADTLLELMARITGEEPRMWGPSIIGFGGYHYKYVSRREGDAPAAGFSPRRAATSVYLPDGIGTYTEQLARLGEHKTGVGCLYLKDLAKIDLRVLDSIITESYRAVTAGTFGQRAADSRTEQRE